MTGPELDALIKDVERAIGKREDMHWTVAEVLINELKIYRAMALRMEREIHELVKYIEDMEAMV